MTDPIADMLTRIRNAYTAGHDQVSIPFSNLKHQLATKLQELGYIHSSQLSTQDGHQQIIITLKYENKHSVITQIKRISKPGRRVYITRNQIKPTLSGYGTTIITSSAGVLTDKEARQKGVGGEIICQIW